MFLELQSATCASEQTQTVTRQSSTITVAPIQGEFFFYALGFDVACKLSSEVGLLDNVYQRCENEFGVK